MQNNLCRALKLRSRQGQAGATGRALSRRSNCSHHICQKRKEGFATANNGSNSVNQRNARPSQCGSGRKESKHVSRSELEGREDANVAKEMRAKGTTMTPRVYRRRGLFATDVTGSVLAGTTPPGQDEHVQKAVSE